MYSNRILNISSEKNKGQHKPTLDAFTLKQYPLEQDPN